MAYLSFSPIIAENEVRASAADVCRFTQIELRVVALAEREAPRREIAPHSWLGRLLERVFGVKLPRPLADPRLERLRRFASLARHRPDRIGAGDVRALIDAGFTPGQVHGLVGYLSPGRERAHSASFA